MHRPAPRALAVALVIATAACGGDPESPTLRPTTTDAPAEPSSGAPASVAAEPSGDVIVPDATAEPVTSDDFIREALEAGEITDEEAVLYGVYALFGDPRLPEAYRGEWTDSTDAIEAAREGLDGYSEETRAALLPYLVRPSDPDSYWSQLEDGGTGATTVTIASARRPLVPEPGGNAAICVDGWVKERVSASVPVMVWSRCVNGVEAGRATLDLVKRYAADLWGPMTTLMGSPVGDRNVANDGYPDTPENGDGILDVYLVNAGVAFRAPRYIKNDAIASASRAPPFGGPAAAQTSSGYIVGDINASADPLSLKSTMAHELMHILQYAHNSRGVRVCADPTATCAYEDKKGFWFLDASAVWAEHEFVPEGRATSDGPYQRYHAFRSNAEPLSSNAGLNAYNSFTWPLFLEQEIGASAVAAAWVALEGKSTWAQLQAAVGSPLSFNAGMGEFAVRVWNEALEGNPINPRFNHQRLDPDFPTEQPSGQRILEGLSIGPDDGPNGITIRESLHPLWSAYRPIRVDTGVGRLTITFTGWANPQSIGAEVLLKIAGQGWERRSLVIGDNEFCLDRTADAIEDLIVIPYNRDPVSTAIATGSWTIKGETAGCATVTGTLSYTSVIDDPGGMDGTETDSVSINVALEPSDDGSGRFLNEGSGVSATRTTHAEGAADVTGCRITTIGDSRPTGFNLPDDAITGGEFRPNNEFSIAVAIPITMEIETDYCALGVDRQLVETSINFDCVGFLSPSTTVGRRYIFDCEHVSPGWTYSVQGSVVVTTP
jgi:hypothetical protein